jgi:Na+/melibiose symporter-like transporter
MTKNNKEETKSSDAPAFLISGAGAILGIVVGPFKSGAGASEIEVAMYYIGGFLLIALGLIIKMLNK